MDKATAAQSVRTYARNAYTAYVGFAEKLKAKFDNPNTVDAVQDFEKFIELRAKAVFYRETLNLDDEGNSPFDDDKVLDRMQDERQSLTRLLLKSSTQQSGMYAVHQHHVREADKRILSDTDFVDHIEDPAKAEAVEALAWLRKGWNGDNSERAIMAFDTLDNAGVYKSIEKN